MQVSAFLSAGKVGEEAVLLHLKSMWPQLAHRDAVDDKLGMYDLIIMLLRLTRKLNPPRSTHASILCGSDIP